LTKAYHYARYRWWEKIDVDKLANELSEEYNVKAIKDHGWDLELTFMKEARDRYLIKSDTLSVFLSIYRAVMFQKVPSPFTAKDLKLRNHILKLFPKQRETILTTQVRKEPEFQVTEMNQSNYKQAH
jgi:hypothetical protein